MMYSSSYCSLMKLYKGNYSPKRVTTGNRRSSETQLLISTYVKNTSQTNNTVILELSQFSFRIVIIKMILMGSNLKSKKRSINS